MTCQGCSGVEPPSVGAEIGAADLRYAKISTDSGFDSVSSLKVEPSFLLTHCAGVKPGHAASLVREATKRRDEGSGRIVSDTISVADVEKQRLAGDPPAFPVIAGEPPKAKRLVEDWVSRVVSWCRIWSAPAARAVSEIRRSPTLTPNHIKSTCNINDDTDSYMGNRIMLKMKDGDRVLGLFRQGFKDDPMGVEIMSIICKTYLKRDENHITSIRREFINLKPCPNLCGITAHINVEGP